MHNRSHKVASLDYAPTTDRKGRDLKPGDRVRIKTYPKGTVEGTVVVSTRTQQQMPGGIWAPALVVDVDGKIYPIWSKGTLKLGHLKHMEKIATTAELRTELTRLASICAPGVYREAMVSELYALADRIASNAGYEILSGYVGGSAKLQSFLHDSDLDGQTSELLGEVASKLSEELEPKGRIMSALNRFSNLVAKGPKQNPAELRNQIFKVANELGLKLPSGMF